MTALSAEKKKSFAEMAAVGTSITISSMPIAVPQVEQSKPILDNGKLSFSLSDGISNSGESSNATASTDGNSTSSASTYTPSRQGFKAASVPASVSQTAAVSTAAPAKNPWKMNLVEKEPAASERPKNAPTPAESKDMNPVIAVVSSDTSVNAGATLRDKKIKDKPSTGKVDQQIKESEAPSSPLKPSVPGPKQPPISTSGSTSDTSPREKKGDKSIQQVSTGNASDNTAVANPAVVKKQNKDDSTKPQRNKSQSKKTNNGNSAPGGNGTNHKASNNKKPSGQNKNKAIKNKKQTKRKNKSQKKNQANAKGGSNYIPTPQELADFKKSAVEQVEYFFSTDELVRNLYLRKQMDVEGYLPAAIVFNFPSVLMYGIPYQELLDALKDSKYVDVDFENDCLRVKGGEEEYKKWLFPNGDGTFGCAKWIKEPMEVAPVSEAKVAPDVGNEEEKKDDVNAATDASSDVAETKESQ